MKKVDKVKLRRLCKSAGLKFMQYQRDAIDNAKLLVGCRECGLCYWVYRNNIRPCAKCAGRALPEHHYFLPLDRMEEMPDIDRS